MRKVWLVAGLALFFVLSACQPQVVEIEVTRLVESAAQTEAISPVTPTPFIVEVTRVVTTEVTRVVPQELPIEVTKAPLGTAERPVQLLFAPSNTLSPAVIGQRGQILADTLAETTGLAFAIGIADDEAALIELTCTAPADVIAFLSPLAFATARERCGAQLGSVAVHTDGLTWQAGMIVARRDSGITTLADLAGRRGAVPDAASVPNALAIELLLQNEGVEPAELIELPGDNSAMLAVFDGEVDFAVGSFTPPIMPYEERLWEYGVDSPDVSRVLGIAPERSPIGYVLVIGEPEFGGYRLRDARAGVFDIQPEIYNETRVVALSPQIPNETVAFGRDFPLGLARQVTAVLQQFAASDLCAQSLCSADFYDWRGLEPADEAFYAPLQEIYSLTQDDQAAE
jgi:phosphonate transport system substrate-binding protein